MLGIMLGVMLGVMLGIMLGVMLGVWQGVGAPGSFFGVRASEMLPRCEGNVVLAF